MELNVFDICNPLRILMTIDGLTCYLYDDV